MQCLSPHIPTICARNSDVTPLSTVDVSGPENCSLVRLLPPAQPRFPVGQGSENRPAMLLLQASAGWQGRGSGPSALAPRLLGHPPSTNKQTAPVRTLRAKPKRHGSQPSQPQSHGAPEPWEGGAAAGRQTGKGSRSFPLGLGPSQTSQRPQLSSILSSTPACRQHLTAMMAARWLQCPAEHLLPGVRTPPNTLNLTVVSR